jgi:hypothetical protein
MSIGYNILLLILVLRIFITKLINNNGAEHCYTNPLAAPLEQRHSIELALLII